MTDKRTHSEILFDLIERWQKGDVSNRVLIRDLSGMAVNTDHLETANAALEQRVEELEGEGHSMDCDVRKDSTLPPDCSCGWTQRLEDMVASGEDQESSEKQTPKVSPRRAAEIHYRIQRIYNEGVSMSDKTAAQAFRDLKDTLPDVVAPILPLLTIFITLLNRLLKKATKAGEEEA